MEKIFFQNRNLWVRNACENIQVSETPQTQKDHQDGQEDDDRKDTMVTFESNVEFGRNIKIYTESRLSLQNDWFIRINMV